MPLCTAVFNFRLLFRVLVRVAVALPPPVWRWLSLTCDLLPSAAYVPRIASHFLAGVLDLGLVRSRFLTQRPGLCGPFFCTTCTSAPVSIHALAWSFLSGLCALRGLSPWGAGFLSAGVAGRCWQPALFRGRASYSYTGGCPASLYWTFLTCTSPAVFIPLAFCSVRRFLSESTAGHSDHLWSWCGPPHAHPLLVCPIFLCAFIASTPFFLFSRTPPLCWCCSSRSASPLLCALPELRPPGCFYIPCVVRACRYGPLHMFFWRPDP